MKNQDSLNYHNTAEIVQHTDSCNPFVLLVIK